MSADHPTLTQAPIKGLFKDFRPVQAGGYLSPAEPQELAPNGRQAVLLSAAEAPFDDAQGADANVIQDAVLLSAAEASFEGAQDADANQAHDFDLDFSYLNGFRQESRSGYGRFTRRLRKPPFSRERWAYAFALGGLLLVSIAMIWIVWSDLRSSSAQEFNLLGGAWSQENPYPAIQNQPLIAMLSVANNTSSQQAYWVEARSSQQVIGVSGPFVLMPGDSLNASIQFASPTAGDLVPVELLLRQGLETEALQTLTLWLEVRLAQ